jgi:hypothetical protein
MNPYSTDSRTYLYDMYCRYSSTVQGVVYSASGLLYGLHDSEPVESGGEAEAELLELGYIDLGGEG